MTEDLQRWFSFAVTDVATLLRRAKLMLMPPSAVNVIQLVGMFDVYINVVLMLSIMYCISYIFLSLFIPIVYFLLYYTAVLSKFSLFYNQVYTYDMHITLYFCIYLTSKLYLYHFLFSCSQSFPGGM